MGVNESLPLGSMMKRLRTIK